MPATVVRFDVRANPGAELTKIIQTAKESAKLWQEHGAKEVHFYSIMLGEAGCFSFVARFESAAKLGQAIEEMNTDPAVMDWRSRMLRDGNASFVRSNQLIEIPLG